MRVRDTIVLRSQAQQGVYIPGIVIGHKLYNTLNLVEAFEHCANFLDTILIPHSFLVITQEGFYQVHQDELGYHSRRL